MNVLVTGAQGFIGRYLVKKLLQNQNVEKVVGIGRSPQDMKHFSQSVNWAGRSIKAPLPKALHASQRSKRYLYYSINLEDTRAIESTITSQGIEGIIHLAGALRDSELTNLINNNVIATQSLLSAIENCLPHGRLILGSSGSVYGGSASVPALESDRCEPLDPYAVTKLAAENLANVSRRRSGRYSLAIARIFNVIGPGLDERHLASHLARQFAEQKLISNTQKVQVGQLTSTRDFIDVRDVSSGLETLLLCSGQRDGIFNLASGTELHVQVLYDKLSELSRINTPAIDLQSTRLLDINRAFADVSRIRKLGFRASHSIDSSLSNLLDYYLHDVSQHPPPTACLT